METLFLKLPAAAGDIERKVVFHFSSATSMCMWQSLVHKWSHDFVCPMNIHVFRAILTHVFGRKEGDERLNNMETLCLQYTAGSYGFMETRFNIRKQWK